MRLHRFFIGADSNISKSNKNKIILKSDSVVHRTFFNQWQNVFRFHKGDSFILFDDLGNELYVTVDLLSRKLIELNVDKIETNNLRPNKEITLYISLTKRQAFENILQKATEIGVSKIIPVISERSERGKINLERSKKIIIEAVEQSGWAFVPQITEPVKLTDCFTEGDVTRIVFDLGNKKIEKDFFDDKNTISIFIGPEGGWGELDKKIFKENNVSIFSLGPQVLRADTAVSVVLGLVQF